MSVKKVSNPVAPVTAEANEAASASKQARAASVGDIAAKKSITPANAQNGVGVAVSDSAKARIAEQKKAKALAMNAPDVREERVNAIKAKIADGTYNVDSDKIASGMMREAIMEHLTSDENK
jgi:negative regulator of flagellin synthesis FlgM